MPDILPLSSNSDPAVHGARKLDDEEFKAKLEMTKAFCDTSKSYVQIGSIGVALPLLFRQAILGDIDAKKGLLGSLSWSLETSWLFFLITIALGLAYQWLSMRRLWDQYHAGNWTPEKANEPGYRKTKGIMKMETVNLSWVWLAMTGSLFVGAFFFIIYAGSVIEDGRPRSGGETWKKVAIRSASGIESISAISN